MLYFQCVFDIDSERGLVLSEIANGQSVQDIVEATGCEFEVLKQLFVSWNI